MVEASDGRILFELREPPAHTNYKAWCIAFLSLKEAANSNGMHTRTNHIDLRMILSIGLPYRAVSMKSEGREDSG